MVGLYHLRTLIHQTTIHFLRRTQVSLIILCCIAVNSTNHNNNGNVLAFPLSGGGKVRYPKVIKLRGGVLHAPPFAVVHEDGTYSGFQIELLESLQTFAATIDNIRLYVTFDTAPPQYGTSFDLVANDCNTTANPNTLEDCNKFDFIIGNYYATSSRSIRAELSPAWLRSTISTIKSVNYSGPEITTLQQAARAKATVCIKTGTFYSGLVMEKYPDAEYLFCPSHTECVDMLKDQRCVLYPDDEFQLRNRQIIDTSVRLTKESFNTQYIVWPLSFELEKITSVLLKRWMFLAIANGTLDELYFNYFERQECPRGTAGKDCELYCHPEHGKSNVDGLCVCDSAKWIGVDCSTEVPEDFNHIPATLKMLSYFMLGITVVAVLICGIWLYIYRFTQHVRLSQPHFLALVLSGCLISSSTIGFLAVEDDGNSGTEYLNFACMAAPWTFSIGFCITFGTLFAKILSIYRLFRAASTGVRRPVNVTTSQTFLTICGVLIVDIIILIIWTIEDPLEWKREVVTADVFGDPLSSFGYCTSNHWKIYTAIIGSVHLCLLGFASFLCYKTRNISTSLSQGKYVAISMVSNLQMFVVGVPVLLTVGSNTIASFFIRCAIIWINDLMVTILIFGNLMHLYYTKSSATLQEEVVNSLEREIVRHGSRGAIASVSGRDGPHRSTFSQPHASTDRLVLTSHRSSMRLTLQKVSEASKESESKEFSISKEFSLFAKGIESESKEFSMAKDFSKVSKVGSEGSSQKGSTQQDNSSVQQKLAKEPVKSSEPFDTVNSDLVTSSNKSQDETRQKS